MCGHCGARYPTVATPEMVRAIRRCVMCERRALRVDDGTATLSEREAGFSDDGDEPWADAPEE